MLWKQLKRAQKKCLSANGPSGIYPSLHPYCPSAPGLQGSAELLGFPLYPWKALCMLGTPLGRCGQLPFPFELLERVSWWR